MLSSFDSPGRVNDSDIKFTNFINKEVPVEVSNVAIDKGVVDGFSELLSCFLNYIKSLKILITMLSDILIQKRKFKCLNHIREVILIIEVPLLIFPFFIFFHLDLIVFRNILKIPLAYILI